MRRNNLTRAAIAAALSLLAFACASRPPAAPSYPLSNEIVRSADGGLLARLPQGWSSGGHDTLPPGVAAWLVSEDRSGVIALRELSLDRLTTQRVRQEGLTLLARLSFAFRTDSAHPAEKVPLTEYSLGETKVCAYELVAGGAWKSVLVTGMGGKYYECEATTANRAPEATRRLAEAQRAFLGSLAISIRG